MTKESCSCGCGCGEDCNCGCDCDCDCCCCCNTDKEIAFELCRTLIEGRTYTADAVAEAYKKIFDAVKSCKSED
ncbi:MAG: hypothetical protein IJ545_03120 [Alphaproteobacteria bacterium]|nr:hypothetical protein [Alphaproteobacteria bacterium]